MTMKKLQRKDKLVSNRQNDDLWVKRLSLDTKIGKEQHFNKYELVQDKHLKNMGTNENIEQTYRCSRLGNSITDSDAIL